MNFKLSEENKELLNNEQEKNNNYYIVVSEFLDGLEDYGTLTESFNFITEDPFYILERPNVDGSYYCSTYKTEQNLKDNIFLLTEVLDAHNNEDFYINCSNIEALHVSILFYCLDDFLKYIDLYELGDIIQEDQKQFNLLLNNKLNEFLKDYSFKELY